MSLAAWYLLLAVASQAVASSQSLTAIRSSPLSTAAADVTCFRSCRWP